MPVLRTKTSRMWLPDALRGLALLNMLAYHAMYDWVYVFGHESSWYNIWAPGCHVWQQYICWSFILLSGFSFPLAKRPAKNGLIVAGCAAVLTFVTAVFMPSDAIWFGVLHLNAAAVLLTADAPSEIYDHLSADYFPVVPWVFLFWCGLFLARLWLPGRGEPPAALRPLCAIGRNTLQVYMLHQPVIYGALWVWHTVLG